MSYLNEVSYYIATNYYISTHVCMHTTPMHVFSIVYNMHLRLGLNETENFLM